MSLVVKSLLMTKLSAMACGKLSVWSLRISVSKKNCTVNSRKNGVFLFSDKINK